jgi:hypothetical protein
MPSFTPVSVCSTIRTNSSLGNKPIDIHDSNFSPLLTIVDQIVFLPIAWRKFILDACRIQAPINQNNHLLASFNQLNPRYASRSTPSGASTISIDDLVPFIDIATSSPISSSYLSYFVRSETTSRIEEFRLQLSLSLHKEVAAATEVKKKRPR